VNLADWWERFDGAVLWSVGASAVMFVAGILLVRLFVIRIPADYFAHEHRERHVRRRPHPAIYITVLLVKNTLGILLILLGLAQLFVPGQGILTILIGLLLTDMPGKYRLERWIVRRKPVLHTINTVRIRAGHPPLQFDED
jgi:hypothetical protein